MIPRTLTAIVGIAIIIAIVAWMNPLAFLLFLSLVLTLGCFEYFTLLKQIGVPSLRTITLFFSLLFVVSFFDARLDSRLLLGSAIITVLILALVRFLRQGTGVLAALGTLFAILYFGHLLGYQVGIRTLGGEDGKLGSQLLLLFYIIVWSGDTAAYLIGSAIGRHQWATRLSPKKTVEGSLAHILFSLLALWFAQRLLASPWPITHIAILGLLISLAAQLGDLSISLIKREAKMKESSRVLPGHGGILDRLDSLVFSGPIFFYYYQFFLR